MAEKLKLIGKLGVQVVPVMEGVSGHVEKAFEDADIETKGLTDPIEEAMEKAGEESGKTFGEKFKTGLNIASAAIVGGVVAGAKGLYEIGDTFDEVTDTIRAGTGATGDDLDALVDVAKRVGTEVPAEFGAIGTTVADLNTRLGLTGGTLETVSSQVLEAGRVFGEELDVSALGAGFSAFKIEGEGVVDALDYLFVASQATGVGMNELATSAANAAPQMKQLGFGFEDTVSLIGQFDKAGLNSQQVMGGMSKAIVTLAKDGEEPADAFKRVVGEIEGFIATGEDAAALDLASQVFGTRGATAFTNAIKEGKLNVDDLQKGLGATSDTILGVGDDTADFAEKWLMFKNKVLIALEPLAAKVFDGMASALDVIAPKVETFFTWMTDNIDTVKTIGIVVGGLAGAVLAVNAAMTAYNAVVTTVTALTKAWSVIQGIMNITLLGSPLGLIIAGVAALAGVVYLVATNWDTVTGAVKGFFSAAGEILKSLDEGIMNFAGSLGTLIGDAYRGAHDAAGKVAEPIRGFFSDLKTRAADAASSAGERISSLFQNIRGGFGDLITSATSAVSSFMSNMEARFRAIGQGVQNVFRGVANFFIGMANSVLAGVNAIINGLNKVQIDIPDDVPVVGGTTWGINIPNVPTIPALATGAEIIGPTVALIGEEDPEYVVNRGVMNRMMENVNAMLENSNGGVTYQTNVYQQPGQNTEELVEEIERRQRWKAKRRTR